MIRTNEERRVGSGAVLLGFLLTAFFATLLSAEPAHAVTTFTVNSTGDEGDVSLNDPFCDADPSLTRFRCTLRAAIVEANDTEGADTINFDVPGAGVKTIAPSSQLPTVTEQVTIDGYTQPGASSNTKAVGNDAVLLVELNGTNAGEFARGLSVSASNSVVKGLVVNRFGTGIEAHSGTGIRIEGNFVGTDPSGTSAPGNRRDGVSVIAEDSVIGGTTPAKRNLISGNKITGVRFPASFDGVGSGSRVMGNYVGTDRNGTGDLGNNNSGVFINSSNNTVGGATPEAANTIAFNGFIRAFFADGVTVAGGTGNRVLRNSIHSNEDLGVDLNGDGPTANELGDDDAGPNGLQNFPVLNSAATGDSTTLRGKLNSAPGQTFKVRFFSNPSGTDEGKRFIGQRAVTTNADGVATFTFNPEMKVAVGRAITATATSQGGDTSEFSAPRRVVRQR